jgi:hypothetical protein
LSPSYESQKKFILAILDNPKYSRVVGLEDFSVNAESLEIEEAGGSIDHAG